MLVYESIGPLNVRIYDKDVSDFPFEIHLFGEEQAGIRTRSAFEFDLQQAKKLRDILSKGIAAREKNLGLHDDAGTAAINLRHGEPAESG